ncbi:hypothetical protein [Halopelagius longus]|uniref:Uncharacterized protein n=1 Tax=Halopelagius longus TaxID=1236180 RepID=A0A1H0XU90_9EURY|nr:hypothetical protein [Halopelagius longus]RDI72096.1 hypothetical protein DWB78_10420 [Halopelagius longus]SDQ06450.1 hypothetical protein SAMN05216278_0192 [Halopelagius longus]
MSDVSGVLRVEADLTLTVEGETATVSTGPFGDVYVDAPSLASALRIARRVGDLPPPLEQSGDRLAASGLTVVVRVRRAIVARIGEGVESGRLERLAGKERTRLYADGVLTAALRELRGVR